jgi:hypothetical protein
MARWIFDCARVPGTDGLYWSALHAKVGDTSGGGHVVVLRNGHFWRLESLDAIQDGHILRVYGAHGRTLSWMCQNPGTRPVHGRSYIQGQGHLAPRPCAGPTPGFPHVLTLAPKASRWGFRHRCPRSKRESVGVLDTHAHALAPNSTRQDSRPPPPLPRSISKTGSGHPLTPKRTREGMYLTGDYCVIGWRCDL